MEHAKKLALVDPRLVESLLAHQPTTTTTHVLTKLDADMKTILDRTDLHEREKVLLYNQLLDRYNTIDEQRRQRPVRVSMVNPPGEASTVLPPTTVDPSPAVSSLLESEIVESAPKTMKKEWRTRRPSTFTTVSLFPGSNMVGLVNDVLRKRKTSSPVV